MTTDDPTLTVAESVAWLKEHGLTIREDTWRGYVSRGRAPSADEPGEGPVNRRQPKWRESTLRAYLARKNERGGQAWRSSDAAPLGPVTTAERPLGPRQVRVLLELPSTGMPVDPATIRERLDAGDAAALNTVLGLLEDRRLVTVDREGKGNRRWIRSAELTEAGRRTWTELDALERVAAEAREG
jgi:hypothetical protein